MPNLMKLNIGCKCNFSEEDILMCANKRLGWYRRSRLVVVNCILSPKVLTIQKGDRPDLVNPLEYYHESL